MMSSDRPPNETEEEEEEIEPGPPNYDEQEYTFSTTSEESANGSDQEKQQKRLSAFSFADLPEVVPPDTFDGAQVLPEEAPLEVVPGTDPQVVYNTQFPEVYDETAGKQANSADFNPGNAEKYPVGEVEPPKPRRIFGLDRRWFIVGAVSVLVLVIALGAGLGAGLRRSSKPKYEPPANAYNGTKVSLGGLSRVLGDPSDLAMYFQHEDGTVRWMEQNADSAWTGGNSSTIVALDAKPGSPISVVSYNWDNLDNWRVYYIDNTNTLRETWQATQTWTQGWELGLLNNLAVKAWDDPKAAMTACWYGSISGANFSTGEATSTSASEVLIRVVYATNATTFQELTFSAETQVWSTGEEIGNVDATSTPACYNGQPNTTDYLMVVNQQNEINMFWKDMSGTTNTTRHPANRWTNASISIPNAGSGATLAFTNYLFAQDTTSNAIKGYDISFEAENSTVDIDSAFVVHGDAGIPQTGIAVTIEHEEYVLVYQTNGTSVSNFNRALGGGDWTVEGIYIPHD